MVWIRTSILRYRFPSSRSIRILMIRMSAPDPWTLPGGLLPQEADRRWDFVGVVGVSVAGVDSLVGGDVSTSRQDTDGDLICCSRTVIMKMIMTECNQTLICIFKHAKQPSLPTVKWHNINRNLTDDCCWVTYLCELWQQVIDRWVKVKEAVAVTSQAGSGGA